MEAVRFQHGYSLSTKRPRFDRRFCIQPATRPAIDSTTPGYQPTPGVGRRSTCFAIECSFPLLRQSLPMCTAARLSVPSLPVTLITRRSWSSVMRADAVVQAADRCHRPRLPALFAGGGGGGFGRQENFGFYLPFNWRGFYDFGSSLIGDWGIHILGPANWALQLALCLSVRLKKIGSTTQWAKAVHAAAAELSVCPVEPVSPPIARIGRAYG
jgi:hypothetical protein